MFPIIENELQKLNIRYFKLTGATKVDERIDLVDEFNENPEIKLFLISLKMLLPILIAHIEEKIPDIKPTIGS